MADAKSLNIATFGVIALALGSGCSSRDCHEWEDMKVEFAASSLPIDSFEAGLADFREWTGRERTCVKRVEIVPELKGDVVGRYHSHGRWVELHEDASASATVHEFCHALDHEEGEPSQDAQDVLGALAEEIDPERYSSEGARLGEAFARICEDGPGMVQLLNELAELCGSEGASEAATYVASIAFPESSTLDAVGARFSYDVDLIEVQGAEWTDSGLMAGGGVAIGSDLLALVTAWDESASDEAMLLPELVRINVDDRRVEERLSLPPHGGLHDSNGNPLLSPYAIIGSSDLPILQQLAGSGAGRAWRISSSPLGLEELSWPALGEDAFAGFEHEGLVMTSFGYADPLVIVDLADGSWRAVGEGQSPDFDPSRTDGFYADEQGGLGVFPSEYGLTLAAVDWNGAWTWSRAIPVPGSRVRSLFRAPDGSIVVSVVLAVAGGSGSAVVSLRYDPTDDSWALPSYGCDGLADDRWVALDGAAWVVSSTGTETFSLQLVRATL